MPASAGRRRLPARQRREQLLDAAIALAAGGDLTSVSVQELAARAGVSEGLLYHYFPTKQALVVAAVTRAADALLADLRSVATSGTPRQRLEAGLAAYLHHVRDQPTGWRALLAARTGQLADVSARLEQQSRALILQALGVERPSPVLLIVIAGWSAFERDACLAWLDQPTIALDTVADLLLSTFVTALTSAAQHDRQARQALARLTDAS